MSSLPIQPPLSEGPKFSYTQGKTPILTPTEARTLLRSIPSDSVVGLPDRALIGLIVYTFQPCRALIKRYQDKAPRAILDDLIASTPEDAGLWFATAKTLGFLDLAAELAERSPVDIGTLLRAARDHQASNPLFALQAAVAALRWMAAGRFYELRAGDVWEARRFALDCAQAIGQTETIRTWLE